MITKITLKNVASYGEDPVILETDKKINFIYSIIILNLYYLLGTFLKLLYQKVIE